MFYGTLQLVNIMNIKIVVVGYLEENCYILKKDNNILVIDPGDEYEKIKKCLNGNVVGVLITHSHFDHIGALSSLVNDYHIGVYDYSNLKEGINSISNFEFEMIKTPGHKEDAVSYYFKEYNCMFVGDFIFRNSIGRTDLEGGNYVDMKNSIEKIMKYDRDIVIYPGHGDKTILGYEIDNNMYFGG